MKYVATYNNEIINRTNLKVEIYYIELSPSKFNCTYSSNTEPIGNSEYSLDIVITRDATDNINNSSAYTLVVDWGELGKQTFNGNLIPGSSSTLNSTRILPPNPGQFTITITGNCGETQIVLDVQGEIINAITPDINNQFVFFTDADKYLKYI